MEQIINYLHLILLIGLLISPFVDNCGFKLNAFILITFIILHFITKYGKCGIINIERLFLKENFKNGFFYKLIKPIISYKNNIFYENLFNLVILYSIILFIQIYKKECFQLIYNDFNYIKNLFIKKN
jgi:hypothetical protein